MYVVDTTIDMFANYCGSECWLVYYVLKSKNHKANNPVAYKYVVKSIIA